MSEPRVYSGFPTTPVPRDETPTSGVKYPAVARPPPTPDALVVQGLAEEMKKIRRGLYLIAVVVSFELGLIGWMLLRR